MRNLTRLLGQAGRLFSRFHGCCFGPDKPERKKNERPSLVQSPKDAFWDERSTECVDFVRFCVHGTSAGQVNEKINSGEPFKEIILLE